VTLDGRLLSVGIAIGTAILHEPKVQITKLLADDMEEERRLLFVGITRAQEELYLSHAKHRDFRGRRGMTVPSSFLSEMPRDAIRYQVQAETRDTAADEDDLERISRRGRKRQAPGERATSGGSAMPAVTTAAELAGSALPSSTHSPDAFVHGMRVRHPEYGVGRVIALSHEGAFRGATVQFNDASIGQRRFVLAHSRLEPVD